MSANKFVLKHHHRIEIDYTIGMTPGLHLLSALILIGCLSFSAYAEPSTYAISFDTRSLTGTSAQLAFDLIDGGPPANTIVVSEFSTDGALGSSAITGGASGNLPGTITLTDSTFFNEYLTSFTFGHGFSFRLQATTNTPLPGSSPDGFSLAILDPATGLPLFPTTDPTGAGSLLLLNIDGTPQGVLDVYTALGGEVTVTASPVSAVPEPASGILAGVIAVSLFRIRQMARRA